MLLHLVQAMWFCMWSKRCNSQHENNWIIAFSYQNVYFCIINVNLKWNLSVEGGAKLGDIFNQEEGW